MTDDKLIKNTRRPTTATDKEATTIGWCKWCWLSTLGSSLFKKMGGARFLHFCWGIQTEEISGEGNEVTNFGKQNIRPSVSIKKI